MTENAVETVENEQPSFPDEMAEMSFKMLAKLISDRNGLVGKINAVKGDRDLLRKELEENSDNPEAVAARAARDQAQEALDEAIMRLHKAVTPEIDAILSDAEKSTNEIEEQVKESDGKIKPGMAYFKKMYGENLAKHLPSLERLKGFSTRGAGSSGRRIRGYTVTVTLEDGQATDFENVASAAKYLEVETADLQAKFFETAGNPEKLADAPNVVEFTVTYAETDEDGKETEATAKVTCTREVKESDATEAEDTDVDEAEGSDDSE